ncbi:MAG: hypothetical protein KGI33_03610 [Thaumarchaeota archaeon]|nr:hypothetical protein [Nitrososphaerota archaeon]
MTNANDKNGMTKKTTAISAALIVGMMLLPMITLVPDVNAQSEIKSISSSQPEVPTDLPSNLSKTNLQKLENLAIHNIGVQKIINGGKYKFMSQDFVGIGNTWYPEIHINVNNKTQITVTADLANNSVTKVQKYPIFKTPVKLDNVGAGSSFATDYYSGTATIDGMFMDSIMPSFSSSGTNSVTFFLVNALEANAVDSNGCSPAYDTSSYFAQTGFAFAQTTDGPTWTDTDQSCVAQVPNVTYGSTDTWKFEIYVNTSGYWVIYGDDISNNQKFTHTSGVSPTYTTMKTDDVNTSIFFENQNTNTSWYSQFQSSVNATALYRDHSSGNWYNWGADTQEDIDCSGNPYTYPYTGQVIESGTDLSSGNTAVWDLQNMANYHC